MSRQILSRSDRVAQMTKQEELIAKKKREIIEKQKNAELTKTIAAHMSKCQTNTDINQIKVTTITPETIQNESSDIIVPTNVIAPEKQLTIIQSQSSSFRNAFNNDGTFLENFKKVTETKIDENDDEVIKCGSSDEEKQNNNRRSHPSDDSHSSNFVVLNSDQSKLNVFTTTPTKSENKTTEYGSESYYIDEYDQKSGVSVNALIDGNSIPEPNPIVVNDIPPPKNFDLNAIPKPELNLDAIKIPEGNIIPLEVVTADAPVLAATIIVDETETVFSDNDKLPTTLQQLIDMVAQLGDEYEDKLRLRKNELNSSLWFIFSKNSESYQNYRQLLYNVRRKKRLNNKTNKYDPADIYNYDKDDEQYNDSDSDYEYMKETKERNLKNIKEKMINRKYLSSDSDSDDYNDNDDDDEDDDEDDDDYDDAEEDDVIENVIDVDDDDDVMFVYPPNEPSANTTTNSLTTKTTTTTTITTATTITNGIGSSNSSGGVNQSTINQQFTGFHYNDIDHLDDNNDDDDDDGVEYILNQDNKKRKINDEKLLNNRKIKKSRWGDKILDVESSPSSTTNQPTLFQQIINPLKPTTSTSIVPSTITTTPQQHTNNQLSTPLCQLRNDPDFLAYTRQNFGNHILTDDELKKAEEHYKINLLYQDMLKKRQEIDRLAKNGKFKYEYDSDEDITGGTWEHKLRSAEMEATHVWAEALNKQSEGKHHIGDFLPPEELKKFLEQYDAKKNNRPPDLSDYKEYKLKEDNIGFQMLQKLGWKEGQGLGAGGSGIIDPINKAVQRDVNQGLGASSAGEINDGDNEYEAYRKRMMLAYRFRPNPLNNPRRAYY